MKKLLNISQLKNHFKYITYYLFRHRPFFRVPLFKKRCTRQQTYFTGCIYVAQ